MLLVSLFLLCAAVVQQQQVTGAPPPRSFSVREDELLQLGQASTQGEVDDFASAASSSATLVTRTVITPASDPLITEPEPSISPDARPSSDILTGNNDDRVVPLWEYALPIALTADDGGLDLHAAATATAPPDDRVPSTVRSVGSPSAPPRSPRRSEAMEGLQGDSEAVGTAGKGARTSRLVEAAGIAQENAISKVTTNRHLESSPRVRNVSETVGGAPGGGRGVGWGRGVSQQTKWMPVTYHNMEKMKSLTVLPEEGVIYCPIPKVASAEWKRALRWIVGIEDWRGEHSNLHSVVKNGLDRLVDWGINGTELALNSDRFLKFVVVREPAERLVSAFLNKCVFNGYMSDKLKRWGAPSCAYLSLMPTLFPDTTNASLETHDRLRELVEGNPENTFFHFVQGVRREMLYSGGSCNIFNHHFRPQFCFCEIQEFLPLYYVLPFSNMSAEAAAFADRLPEAYDVESRRDSKQVSDVKSGDAGAMEPMRTTVAAMDPEMAAMGIGKGVDKPRREEIRVLLTDRFERARDTPEKVTHAADQKSVFLSKRVMAVMQDLCGRL